ncbi:MAG: hypothetical protein J6V24_13275, partial [Clostridia bacterium]|nr:hypothetical protein [Clostridia bacterium]
AIWGIDAGDEPSALDFPHYGKLIALAEELFPGKLVYLNLYPNYASVAENTASQVDSQLGTATYQEYIDRYVESVKTDYLCLDNYEFAAGTQKLYDNLRIAANACRDTGRDFWMVIQVNSSNPEKWLSTDMLRHQAFACLAFGAVSLNWACWTAGWKSPTWLIRTSARSSSASRTNLHPAPAWRSSGPMPIRCSPK